MVSRWPTNAGAWSQLVYLVYRVRDRTRVRVRARVKVLGLGSGSGVRARF